MFNTYIDCSYPQVCIGAVVGPDGDKCSDGTNARQFGTCTIPVEGGLRTSRYHEHAGTPCCGATSTSYNQCYNWRTTHNGDKRGPLQCHGSSWTYDGNCNAAGFRTGTCQNISERALRHIADCSNRLRLLREDRPLRLLHRMSGRLAVLRRRHGRQGAVLDDEARVPIRQVSAAADAA